ncbi:MAG: hypothetical protein CSA42_07485, partial [Gammaproteobacteria bacterium]
SLSQLALDGGLAFRVKFAKAVPKNDLLYWRGPVLSDFDGKTWRRDTADTQAPKNLRIEPDSKISYTTYHDGSTGTWLVPLDLPAEIPANTRINQAFAMQMRDPLAKPTAFQLQSYSRYRTDNITPTQRPAGQR